MDQLISAPRTRALLIAGLLAAGLAGPAQAGIFGRTKAEPPAAAAASEPMVAAVQIALDEERYADAGRLLDRAFAAGLDDPRLILQSGQIHLAKGRHEAALKSFGEAAKTPALAAKAAEGRGLALSHLRRSDDALAALNAAVAAQPDLWRAWNGLGVEYDRRKDWPRAEAAYQAALAAAKGGIVHNNRGYSRLLQGRYDEAAADFVAALQREPGLAQARTNLRLTLAMRGDYERATAVGAGEDRGAILNNAGFAALMRGDLPQAEAMLSKAMETRGQFYARASENLILTRSQRPDEAPAQAVAP